MFGNKAKARILICENDTIIAADLESRLTEQGYTVCGQAASSEAAFELVEQYQPDLVILNIALKGEIDGMAVAEIIQDKWGIYIIFLITSGEIDRFDPARLTFPFGYIFKPFRNHEIKVATRMALNAAKMDEERRESRDIFKIFSKNAIVGHYVIQDGIFKYVNPKFAEIFNYTVEECLDNMPFEHLVHADDIPKVRKQIKRRIKGQTETVHYHFTGLKKNRETVEVEIYGTSMRYQGKPSAIGTILDITEQKHAERALRQSESLLNATGEMAKVGGWELDIDTLELKWTEQAYRILDYPRNFKPYYRDIIDLLHTDDQEKLLTAETYAMERGVPFDLELRIITVKGNNLWVRIICNPQIVEGKVVKLKGTFQDITALKQVEEALKESEKRYRTILEIATDGFCLIDHTGHIVEVNESYCRMTGYSEQELLSMELKKLEANETSDDFNRHIQKIMEEGKDRFETVNRRKDGSLFDIEVTVQYNNEYGGFFSAFLRDITDRKQAEEALKESEERFRSIIEFSPLGIGIVNTKGVIVDANKSLTSMLGYEVQDLIGMSGGGGLTHPEDLMKEQKMVKALLLGEIKSYNIEKRYQHHNSEYYWYNVTVAQMLHSYSDEPFLIGFIEDITKRKKLEQEREHLINDLQNAIAEIKELRGIIPMCANCKKIRDDTGYWQQVEKYIMDRTNAEFSHGLCPDCLRELYPDIADKLMNKTNHVE